MLATCVRWPGAVSARATLQLADGRAESPLESLVRLALHDQGLALPDLQVDVLDQHGSFIGRVDMLYRRQRTVIEADGQLKYTDLELWREKQRQERLERAGYRVIRVLWADLRTPATLADRVRWALAHAA